MSPADSASRAGDTPEASGDSSSGTFAENMTAPHDFLARPPAPLPSERDFDPHAGDLDAQCAWKNFGGLSIKQAYKLFITRPEVYQEDFMFMGIRAFTYYFPVIDYYLRVTERDPEDFGDCEASILGSCVALQFSPEGIAIPIGFLEESERLADFVLSQADRYSATKGDRRRILREWNRAKDEITKQNANRLVQRTPTRGHARC